MARRLPWRYLAPAAVFLAIAGVFAVGLRHDPQKLPSTMIGRSVPAFDLPALAGRHSGKTGGLASGDLKGEAMVVNVFASWCGPCRIEHPILMRMAEEKIVVLHGIDQKDKPGDANAWLANLGDPYERIGSDRDGRASIEWGVYGVPETFVVDRTGHIRYKQVGPITAESFESLMAAIAEAKKEPLAASASPATEAAP